MKISIIMPVYNAQEYIHDAIDSIIKQTYKNWELIIIDDCSKDSTLEICKDYAKRDDRIKVYKNDINLGISRNKNKAMTYATGEYITFCDDDDTMEADALKDNVELAHKYNADVVRWSYNTIKVDENNVIYKKISTLCEDKIYNNRKEIFSDYGNVHKMLSCDWTGLYKKSILDANKIIFNENYKFGGEDTGFNVEVLKYVNVMVMNSNIYYNWFLRKAHSTTAKHNINFCHSMIEVADLEYQLLCENGSENVWEEYGRFYEKLIKDYAKNLSDTEKNEVDNEINKQKWISVKVVL